MPWISCGPASPPESRGEFSGWDFKETDLTMDGSWQEDGNALDLSSIVPVGAREIQFRVQLNDNTVGTFIQLASNEYNTSNNQGPAVLNFVATQTNDEQFSVGCDADRRVAYRATAGINTINIAVVGWWLNDSVRMIDVDTDSVSNPPTDAELDALYGTPATVGAGFTKYLDNNGAGTNFYQITSSGTDWWTSAFTKAT